MPDLQARLPGPRDAGDIEEPTIVHGVARLDPILVVGVEGEPRLLVHVAQQQIEGRCLAQLLARRQAHDVDMAVQLRRQRIDGLVEIATLLVLVEEAREHAPAEGLGELDPAATAREQRVVVQRDVGADEIGTKARVLDADPVQGETRPERELSDAEVEMAVAEERGLVERAGRLERVALGVAEVVTIDACGIQEHVGVALLVERG